MGKIYLKTGKKKEGIDILISSLKKQDLSQSELDASIGVYDYVAGDFQASEMKLKKALRKSPELHDTRILLIINLLNQTKFSEAIEVAKTRVQINSSQHEKIFQNLMAQAFLRIGQIGKAEDSIKNAQRIAPNDHLTNTNLAALYFFKKQYKKSSSVLEKILKKNKQDSLSTIQLSRAYQAMNKNQKAQELLNSFLEVSPTNFSILKEMVFLQIRNRNFDKALHASEEIISLYPESTAAYIVKSQVYATTNNISKALTIIDKALTKINEDRNILMLGAKLAFSIKHYKTSLQYLDRYLSYQNLLSIYDKYLYVRLLIETAHHSKARSVLAKELLNEKPESQYLIGLSFAKEGQFQKAEGCIEKAIEQDVNLHEAFYDLGRIKLMLGKIGAAINLFNKAIDINGNVVSYYLALAQVYDHQGEIDLVIELYKRGVSKFSNSLKSIPLLNNLALAYLKKSNFKEAILFAQKALKLNQENSNILDTLGWIYSKANNHEESLPYLAKAVKKMPKQGLFHAYPVDP